ncbi:uncharacterized protein HD556DRAFT_1444339 [Suillus plorans]|uniref:Uncharacterized protein n=1 Tax=Suillus plorans TaxID=116603 RepID=A0A9P7APF2_9AGAM|nr:uncharacterized protein HD556DRAFT_1444339 [Suillus plorans]KAG1792661.1 hypothetical protein HD556DRAFT_1444339 [Suillus plorans]
MEKMSNTTAMTCCNSATSMSITNAPVMSPNNRLTPAERKAFARSDHKAGKVLGVTLTRNHVGQDNRQDQENFQGDNEEGAVIGTKRSFSRNASTATIIGPLKDRLGRILASGMKMVEKRNKGRMATGGYPPRIVLGLLRYNESVPGKDGMGELPTGVSDQICPRSLAELDENENTEAPLGAEFLERNEEEEDDLFGGSPTGLVRDVENPLASPALDRRVSPVASPEVSSEEESLALSSDDSFDYMLRPAERAYVDFLIAQDEAEGQTVEKIALRSRNKVLDVLGAEARQAFCDPGKTLTLLDLRLSKKVEQQLMVNLEALIAATSK